MKNAAFNPFRPTRWEHQGDGRPLIWFTEVAESLAHEKSTYVYGSRGSGKTTLLKSICWEDLIYNDSLCIQKTLEDFEHIGIYIRFPDHISGSMYFIDWNSVYPNVQEPDYEFHKYFSLMVELCCLERTLSACHSLRKMKYINYRTEEEIHLVSQFMSEFEKFSIFRNKMPATFLELAQLFRDLVRQQNEACNRGGISELVEKIPAREPYQILSYVLESVSDFARWRTGKKRIRFKFCLDDCEVLNNLQRKSLNTLVRLSRAPVSWVVTSVAGVPEDSSTFIQSQPLTDADRRVIFLDDISNGDFQNFCQAVVSLRVLFSLSKEHRENLLPCEIENYFNLKQRFGERDVNDIIEMMLNRSTRPLTQVIEEAATCLLNAIEGINIENVEYQSPRTKRQKTKRKKEKLPYYEAYILLHWRGDGEKFADKIGRINVEALADHADKMQIPSFHAWLRRKQRAALLHISSVLGIRKIPLCGNRIILSLADSSIRDFLEIVGEIYDAYLSKKSQQNAGDLHLERFARTGSKIPDQIQTIGIYSASNAYVKGVSRRANIDIDIVARLVQGLGHYTGELQSSADGSRTLVNPERGIFILADSLQNENKKTSNIQYLEDLIRQAELSGYIRRIKIRRLEKMGSERQSSDANAFRLHRRFAPFYRFSYRGAYNAVGISSEDILDLCRQSDTVTPRDWALHQLRSGQLSLDQTQFTLPLEDDPEDD